MDINKKAIARRINNIRLTLGKNTREFGELFNPPASDSIVSRWESAKSLPNSKRLAKIAELGGISVQELLYGDEREYIYPLIINIAAKQYDIDLSNDLDTIHHIFNRLYNYSYDDTEESLYSENKEIFDSILLYPFDLDSEGLVRISTLDLTHIINKINDLTNQRKKDISKEEFKDLNQTKDLVLNALNTAHSEINKIEIDPKYSSYIKWKNEREKEIKENANTEILDPKHD